VNINKLDYVTAQLSTFVISRALEVDEMIVSDRDASFVPDIPN